MSGDGEVEGIKGDTPMLKRATKSGFRCRFTGHSLAGCFVIAALCSAANARDTLPATGPDATPAAQTNFVPDAKRLDALGMIETGNNDREIGEAGEISRYQIHPVVWKSYSKSTDYWNPDVSLQVACQHWNYLANYFKARTGREPDDFDMYVLWNTRYGYYARKGFSQTRISPVVQARAQRFVNLVNRRN